MSVVHMMEWKDYVTVAEAAAGLHVHPFSKQGHNHLTAESGTWALLDYHVTRLILFL